MKFKKDVLATLATVAAVLVALFAIFVTIPVWLVSVVATLAVVGACVTANEIVRAYKASYDEAKGKHTYKFPVREVVFGSVILVAVAAIVLLSLKRLFGFALIPVAVLLAILLVIAILKKLRVMQIVVGLILALLVVALIGYFTSYLVHNGTNLNPGISDKTTTSETDTNTTDASAIEETDGSEDTTTEEDVTEDESEDTTSEEDVTEDESEETVPETDEDEVEAPKIENNDENEVDDKPVADVEKPENESTATDTETELEDTDVPVIIKIDAPETMSYAEPITIKLEGINANNLKFGNEDFLYIDIISDSEVEITLIGIVNDAGEVEFVPASGYITVTDPVSGVNVTIDIVE